MGASYLRAQELKHNLGQDVILSLQRSGPCDLQSGPGHCLPLPQGFLVMGGSPGLWGGGGGHGETEMIS